MCDYVTAFLQETRNDPPGGAQLISGIIGHIREHLDGQTAPKPMIEFSLYRGAVAQTEPVKIRVEFSCRKWEKIREALNAEHCGEWDDGPVYYSWRPFNGCLLEVSADVDRQQVLVVLW